MSDEPLLERAIALAVESASSDGGPFGAVVARDGEILGEGTNRVVASHDPTAHAEVVALRAAAAKLGTHDLDGATVYVSCEPCPMCLGALWWARVDAVVYAADRDAAAAAGFDDATLYEEVSAPRSERRLPLRRALAERADAPFAAWAANPDRVRY